MAQFVPTPRSYQQILGDIVSAFKARFGIRQMKTGSAILTAIEAAAQSDLRSTQDVFNALDLRDVSRLSGQALEFAARDEGLTRLPALAATGTIDISDTSFQRINTQVYSGAVAPVAGTTTLRVVSAEAFPATGSVYIGRGTNNVEGPLAYSAKTQFSGFWTLTLSSPTVQFHNQNEDVVLAQGGNRTIASGTTVSTVPDARSGTVQFVTTETAQILDGETLVINVPILAQVPGTSSNVARGAVRVFTASPFANAVSNNPQPVTSGQDIESDDQLRQRLILVKSSKSRGTAFAILSSVNGVFSPEENKRVSSTTIVQPADEPATVYIDDGTGYEEATTGIPYEVLQDNASGGEQYFALTGARPISKAFSKTTLSGPFSLASGAKLACVVGGVYSEHSFSTTEFTAISSAQAVEIVSSINNNPDILFSARTADNGTKVAVFARSETNDDIQVTVPSSGDDANEFLGFSTDTQYTVKLYKNDQLLYKDGRLAVVNSAAQTTWNTISSGVYFKVSVDGTPATEYQINNADFIAANTGYTTVSKNNSIASWAAVLNAKVPGLTASDGGGYLILTSNKGLSSAASIEIESGTSPSLVSAGMFTSSVGLSGFGLNKDFTINRNTAQIKLFTPLRPGDSLTVGSFNTRGAAQSADFASGSITLTDKARLWIAVDGGSQIIPHGTSGSTTYGMNHQTGAWTLSPALSSDPLLTGDVAVVWDTAVSTHGAFKVMDSTTSSVLLRYYANTATQAGVSLLSNGLVFVRTNSYVQQVRLPAGTLTLDAVVATINEQLIGATAYVYKGKSIRIQSNDYTGGDIMVVTADTAGQQLGFTLGTLYETNVPHIASVQSGSSESYVPDFNTVCRVVSDNTNQALPQLTTEVSTSEPIQAGKMLFGLNMVEDTADNDILYPAHLGGRFKEISYRDNDLVSVTTRAKQAESAKTQFSIAIGGLVRVGSTVTATTSTSHGFKTGDIVFVGPLGTADGNFAANKYAVASTPSSTTFTYTNAGAATVSTQPYGVNLWDDASVSSGNDLVCLVNPFSVGPYDSLSLVMDSDPEAKSFTIPMYRNVELSGVPSSTLDVTDSDNGGADLDNSFGTGEFFNDFWCYMRPRAISHLGVANKSILWRQNRFGSERQGWSVTYAYPDAASQPMSHEIVDGDQIQINLPSGAARSGLNIFDQTFWTLASVASFSGRTATLTYHTTTANINTIQRLSNVVTVNTFSIHGLSVGQVVYISGVTDAVNFPSGPKVVTSTPSSNQFLYTESGANASSTSGFALPTASPPNFGSVVVGDIIHLESDNPAWTLEGSFRITAKTASSLSFFVPAASVTAMSTPTALGSASGLTVYPINTAASTANDVVTYATAELSDLLTAEIYDGTGAATISISTLDEDFTGTVNYDASSVPEFTFYDGVNYVQTSDLSVSPNIIQFKQLVSGTYTLPWTNEEARLVPVNNEDIVAWLNSDAVTGLSSLAEFSETTSAGVFQIASRQPGDLGAVQISGNQLNGQTVPVVGIGSSSGYLPINRANEYNLLGDTWVAVQNTDPYVLSVPGVVGGTTTLSLGATGTATFSTNIYSSQVWNLNAGQNFVVQKVGRFALYAFRGSSDAPFTTSEGDYMELFLLNGSAANNGFFQVIRSGTVATTAGSSFKWVWVENPNAVSEAVVIDASDIWRRYEANSVIPGDEIEIGFEIGSALNIGRYEVLSISGGNVANLNATFVPVAATTVTASQANQLKLIKPSVRRIKRVTRIGIDPNSPLDPLEPGQAWVFTDSSAGLSLISQALGGNIEPLSRLDFVTTPNVGANGYNVSTGLIAEVTRVLYGDLDAPTLYPGVVAAGASVNISGPTRKRISVSLQIRLRTGATQQSVLDRVRSAVAAAVNSIPLGVAVDISRIVSAARGVAGVAAVSVLSPTYSSSSDLISVQSNEKTFVFDPDADIQLTVAV